MSVLVTGSQGFLGRYVVAELAADGAEVIGLGRSEILRDTFSHSAGTGPAKAPLPATLRAAAPSHYVRVALEDEEAIGKIIRQYRPSRIIHLAGALRDEPWPTLFAGNVMATANLCRAAARLQSPPPILIGSSGSVYGAQAKVPVSETALPQPIGAYAATKFIAEIAARATAGGAPLAIARIFNLLGPGLQRRHLAADLAHSLAEIEAGRAPPVLRLGDLSPVRDFVDVRDVARSMAHWPDVLAHETVNLASGTGTAIQDLVAAFLSASHCPISIEQDAARSRPGADVMIADVSRGAITGPGIALEQSLADMLEYARRLEALCDV